jgi:hypothetical protein
MMLFHHKYNCYTSERWVLSAQLCGTQVLGRRILHVILWPRGHNISVTPCLMCLWRNVNSLTPSSQELKWGDAFAGFAYISN